VLVEDGVPEGLHALARDWKGTDSVTQAAAVLDAMIAAAPDASK